MEITLTVGETTAEALLKIFEDRITEQDLENAAEESDADKESRSDEDNEKISKKILTKDAMARDATEIITADCDNILAFLQAVALKSPRIQAAPLLLRADKRETGWFLQWADIKL